MTAHSKYSPSGSKRWIECPASIQMIDEMGPQEESYNFPAEEGTAAHELASTSLENEKDAIVYINEVFNGMAVDMEMVNQTQKYIDYVNGCATWESTVLIEKRVSLEHIYEDMFGTADAIVYDETDLEVIDLKYGRGIVVEPYDNPQLMLYACGVLKMLEDSGHPLKQETEVKLTIFQPRAPHKEGPSRSFFITVSQLKAFEKLVQHAVEKSKEVNPPFGPGEETCRWCPANAICSPHAAYMLEQVQLEFAEFKKPSKEFRLLAINSMEPEDVARILQHSKAVTNWLKNLADFATNQMSKGVVIPGFKLVYGRSIRKLADIDETRRILLDYGTDEERLYNNKFKTAPQLEKALTDDEWKLIENQVIKPQGNITLAPSTDGRVAVDSNLEAQEEWK